MSELLASLRLKGISGGGNGAVITVTYGADFYNQTFVATNNVDTVSVVATSSGTVDIDVPSEGSWVISCTIGADTYTSDPVLVELSYEATITAIPDGSTVLPTDDIETWLECAGITDKAYTTLAEVLADTDTYTTLLGDSNACDYMARSTTWSTDIVADADAMRLLGMYDYACYVLRQDNTWNTAINNSAYASYIPASPTGQTDIIVSAPSDTIYYMNNGSPVTLCTTDTDGIGSVDWSDLPTGDITLYSSVAKDPTDLTADYSKTIKVTKNKVEGYLMPDSVLYWYGYKSAYVQNSTTNTNNISFDTNKAVADTLTGADRRSLLVSNIGINANTVYFIWQGVNMVTSNYGGAWNANSMISTPASNTPNLLITTTNIEVASLSITSGQYIAVGAAIGSSSTNRKSIIYAIYY